MQGRGRVTAPSTVQQGGSLTITVNTNAPSVEITGPTGSSQSIPLPANGSRTVTVPVPPVPAGTVLLVTVGKGLDAKGVFVEVVGTE